MATILKGAPVVAAMNERNAALCEQLKAKGITPTLAVVRVGEREDDLSYERGVMTRCGKVGVAVKQFVLPADATQEQLLRVLDEVNTDDGIHGCLLFRPLPKQFDDRTVRAALRPEKDIDGITDGSLAGVFTNTDLGYAPCTAQACMEILKYYNVPLSGKRAVVVGRSLVVGKPAAMMLDRENATVTLCNSRTQNLPEVCRQADIVVVAMGKMAAILVHAQQLCNGQPPDFADNENVQPAVIRDCFRPGEETAAVGFAVADGAHQAVHRQLFAVDDEGQLPADVSAELLHDGEQIGHLTAAQRDAPELGDAVGHLCVQTGGTDGSRKPQTGAHQVDGHCPAGQLGVQIQKLFLCTIGAQKVVAAAIGQAAHGGLIKAVGTGERLVEGAVTTGGKNVKFHPGLLGGSGGCTGQFPGVACVGGDADGVARRGKPGPGSSCRDLLRQGAGTVGLSGCGVQKKQRVHRGPPCCNSISFIIVENRAGCKQKRYFAIFL